MKRPKYDVNTLIAKRGCFLLGVEVGVRLAEKGNNLQACLVKAAGYYDGTEKPTPETQQRKEKAR